MRSRSDRPGVAVVEDVLPAPFCRWLLDQARTFYFGGSGFPDTNAAWQASLREGAESPRIHAFDDRTASVILGFLKGKAMLSTPRAHVMFHAWPVGSSIPWHTDGGHAGGATVYLNDVWKAEWGGHFLHRPSPDAEPAVVVPRFNLGVRNEAKVEHRTTPVSPLAPEPRFTLQAFGIGSTQDGARRAAQG